MSRAIAVGALPRQEPERAEAGGEPADGGYAAAYEAARSRLAVGDGAACGSIRLYRGSSVVFTLPIQNVFSLPATPHSDDALGNERSTDRRPPPFPANRTVRG